MEKKLCRFVEQSESKNERGGKILIKYFNIHNLVKIKIQSNINLKIEETFIHLREFEETFLDDKDIDIFIYDYSKCPNFKTPIALSNYYYYSDNYLNIPDERFCFNFIDKPLVMYCDNYRIPLKFAVELILLNEGYSFMHSAAVEYTGKNYLFPAFGGIGKTTTVAAIVYSGGKLFGDDLNIVNERKILSCPIDFAVYPYHLDILKIKNKKIEFEFKKTKILDNITNNLKGYNVRVIKLIELIINSIKTPYVNVPPKRIFGENCIVEKGQIDEIYYLCRVENNLPEITVERIDPDNLADLCSNILLQEWHGSMSILYTYSGLSTFSLNSLFSKIKNIFGRTFMHYECYQIKIPNDLDNLTYQKQLVSYLNKGEKLSGVYPNEISKDI